MTVPVIACLSCVHYRISMKCAAFPDGIPDDIASGKNLHNSFTNGDNGIKYKSVYNTTTGKVEHENRNSKL